MRIEFEDKSYIAVEHSMSPGKIVISIGAKSARNALETIVNHAEITAEQLQALVGSLQLQK